MYYLSMESFEWDENKDKANQEKHHVSFEAAQKVFLDSKRVIAVDESHSTEQEKRFYCIGKIGNGILTVRFTYREEKIRIFGAGFWRKGKKAYEEKNQIHKRANRRVKNNKGLPAVSRKAHPKRKK